MNALLQNPTKSSDPVSQVTQTDVQFPIVSVGQSLAKANQPIVHQSRKTFLATGKTKIQNFSLYAPSAKDVQLVGCFTNWQEHPIKLRKAANGLWWTAVRLERGTYYYRFLVDGQWRDDPDCALFVPNPFGCQNAVRQVN